MSLKGKGFHPVGSEYRASRASAPTLLQVARTRQPGSDPSCYVDDAGKWISGCAPIGVDDRNGDTLIVGIDISAHHIQEIQRKVVSAITVATGLALVLAIPVGIIAGHWMCRPLKIITRRLGKLSELDLTEDPTPIPGAWVDEIEQLCNANHELSLAMRSFALYLPQDVVRKLLASNEIAKLGGALKRLPLCSRISEALQRMRRWLRSRCCFQGSTNTSIL